MKSFKEFLNERLTSIKPSEPLSPKEIIQTAIAGEWDKVKEMLDEGYSINGVFLGMDLLSIACRDGKKDMVEWLLDNGADINSQNTNPLKNNMTPLMSASANDHLGIVKLLIKRGADINAKTSKGYDVFYYAQHNPSIKKYLESIKKD